MNFKIDLQYQDTDDRNYVKTIFEIFDENDNSLYIKSVTSNNYIYFSNRIIVDENIFYNFTKNIKKILNFRCYYLELLKYSILKMKIID